MASMVKGPQPDPLPGYRPKGVNPDDATRFGHALAVWAGSFAGGLVPDHFGMEQIACFRPVRESCNGFEQKRLRLDMIVLSPPPLVKWLKRQVSLLSAAIASVSCIADEIRENRGPFMTAFPNLNPKIPNRRLTTH